jgi:hypothetical protein
MLFFNTVTWYSYPDHPANADDLITSSHPHLKGQYHQKYVRDRPSGIEHMIKLICRSQVMSDFSVSPFQRYDWSTLF